MAIHKPTPAELTEFLTRRTEKIVGEKELRKALTSGKQLIVKHGVDVTAPDLHLGHSLSLWTMRQLQEWGHKVVFLIGDFTTQIGDPTGKSETRKIIPLSEIRSNAKEYVRQVNKVLLSDPKLFEIRYNSEWFGKMKTSEFLSILSHITYAQLIERDMFQKRIKEGKEIRMHEMLYPTVQGYDSAMLEDHLTVVGNDQLFNEMMGRFYQEKLGQPPQAIMTTPILVGTDGAQKMGKSLNNYIALKDSPKDKYGKVMTIADSLIYDYFRLATSISTSELKKIGEDLFGKEFYKIWHTNNRPPESRYQRPSGEILDVTLHFDPRPEVNLRDLKMKLAHTIVSMYDGAKAADKAQEDFVNQFQKNQLPKDMPTHKLIRGMGLLDLLLHHKLIASKSEGRRLIEQGGVRLNELVLTDPNTHLAAKTTGIIQIGKRRFLQLK